MKYRAEIDGLRAVAVVPVILFHAGVGTFSGGFAGVDVFFVISGYLITTILIEDLANGRFSLRRFYERRARRILPALFTVLLVSTVAAYVLLYPTDLEEYGNSLFATLFFVSNLHFRHSNDYFAVETELVPLLHTWSLAVEEQYYIFFPLLLAALWKLGVRPTFLVIAGLSVASLALSEWGWRHDPDANFYHIQTRAWELFTGALVAFAIRSNGVRARNLPSALGLLAVLCAFLFYDQQTPFPSLYAVLPVLGTAAIILYAGPGTFVRTLLGTRAFVGLGLVSYSAYLWHQPLMAFYRRMTEVTLSPVEIASLSVLTFVLAYASWRFVERPFRHGGALAQRRLIRPTLASFSALVALAVGMVLTQGASYRFDFPRAPEPWSEIRCHGKRAVAKYEDPLASCLGRGDSAGTGNIYLLGESHAAQITFALKAVAARRNVDFFFINTEDREQYPHVFWRRETERDPILEHMLAVARPGDFFVTSFHRGRLNEDRDVHIPMSHAVAPSKETILYQRNMSGFLTRMRNRGLSVFLVKDGPLLFDADTSLEKCMYEFSIGVEAPCAITLAQDRHTRTRQSMVFDELAQQFDFVQTLDYLPVLYSGDGFSPISENGTYLMFDRHHLTEEASLRLVDFFDTNLTHEEPSQD